jgi:DNA-binding CsgD family transcriptional regulator
MMRDETTLSTRPNAEAAAMTLALEAFGRALLGLLECQRCFVVVLSRATGFAVQAVRVGFGRNAQTSADVITHLARRVEWEVGSLFAVAPEDPLATELLGRAPEEPPHALAGKLLAGEGLDLIFLAGWRPIPFCSVEIGCVSRAADLLWAMSQGQRRATGSVFDRVLDEFAFPAFIVDHKLRMLETNDAGRQLLLAKNPVHLEHGILSGSNALVSGQLQQALRDTLAAHPARGWANMIIPLSTDHRAFAFAWMGAAPSERHRDRVVVIIPQIDPAAGARRIATAFGLPWAEERIVARILCGQPPSRIGIGLDLTEATVRTYIKRIMLKLGINRQHELFLLYILTLSPFVDGSRDKTPTAVSGSERPFLRMGGLRQQRL